MGSGGDWEGREYRPAEDFDGQSLACGVHLYADCASLGAIPLILV